MFFNGVVRAGTGLSLEQLFVKVTRSWLCTGVFEFPQNGKVTYAACF